MKVSTSLQLTLSCGERPQNGNCSFGKASYNSRSPAESDPIRRDISSSFINYNSRSSAESDKFLRSTFILRKATTHALLWRATTISAKKICVISLQLTLSCGERLCLPAFTACSLVATTHALLRRATKRMEGIFRPEKLQLTHPRGGDDRRSALTTAAATRLQLTHPRGVRHNFGCVNTPIKHLQLTLPCRERLNIVQGQERVRSYNSRSPSESDCGLGVYDSVAGRYNSRSPAESDLAIIISEGFNIMLQLTLSCGERRKR